MPKSNAIKLRRDKQLPPRIISTSSNRRKLLASPGFKKALAIGTSASISMAGLFGLGGHLTGVHKGVAVERARVEHLQKVGFRGPALNTFSKLAEVYKLDLSKKEHVDFLHIINVAAREARTTPQKVCFYLEKTPAGTFKSEGNFQRGVKKLGNSQYITAAEKDLHLSILTALENTASQAGNPKLFLELGTHVQKSNQSYHRLISSFKL
jgi:hypothetical protein